MEARYSNRLWLVGSIWERRESVSRLVKDACQLDRATRGWGGWGRQKHEYVVRACQLNPARQEQQGA
eukprot:33601-Chlamydomonas_euryale.AAC.1